MSGRTEIINQALLYAKQDLIFDPMGESKNSKLCEMVYEPTLHEALTGHVWTFALVAAQLQLLAHKPLDHRFEYAYQLPANFGKMQVASSGIRFEDWVEDTNLRQLIVQYGNTADSIPVPEYVVHGSELYSNYQHIQIIYTRTDIQPHEMSPQFRNYFSSLIALKLYTKVTGSEEGLADLDKYSQRLLLAARNADGDQMDTMPPNRPNLFIRARVY